MKHKRIWALSRESGCVELGWAGREKLTGNGGLQTLWDVLKKEGGRKRKSDGYEDSSEKQGQGGSHRRLTALCRNTNHVVIISFDGSMLSESWSPPSCSLWANPSVSLYGCALSKCINSLVFLRYVWTVMAFGLGEEKDGSAFSHNDIFFLWKIKIQTKKKAWICLQIQDVQHRGKPPRLKLALKNTSLL